ncbi:MAG: CvpA family protein [Anaerolineaceae bacterium]|nr:CvpA family protein [Anaerolineaceae bacterium]
MIEMYAMLYFSAGFFAIIGILRGWNKEVISMAGILLALFALFQFDNILRGIILATVPSDQVFLVQVGLFGMVVYFAYQSRSIVTTRGRRANSPFANGLLGLVMGAINGYLIWGSIWYFLDINDYPFNPIIIAPSPTSVSAQSIGSIPLVLLGGGAGGSGELLTIALILLFLLVIFVL